MDAIHWTETTSEISYIKPGQWWGNNTIDWYLLQHWLKIKDESPVLYLNTYHTIICSHLYTPSSQEYKTIWRSLLLTEDGMVPLRPIAFIIYIRLHIISQWSWITNTTTLPPMVIVSLQTTLTLHKNLRNGQDHIFGRTFVHWLTGSYLYQNQPIGSWTGNRWERLEPFLSLSYA